MGDLISVIIPVYNVEPYLDRCIQSIINQTYSNLDIILIDDGSTDSSGKICDHYKNIDDRITVIHKENLGLGYARNSGLDISKGKYVIFVDSDDYIELDMIKTLYEDTIKYGVDTCIGGYKRVYKTNIKNVPNKYGGDIYKDSDIKTRVLAKMFGVDNKTHDFIEMSVWRVLFSNEIIKKDNIRFPSEKKFISEDIIFDTDYYPNSKRLYISNTNGYCYCDNENSLTTRYRKDRFEKQIELYQELVKRGKQLNIYEEIKQRQIDTLISIARYSIKLEVKFSKNSKETRNNIKRICSDSNLKIAFAEYNSYGVKITSRLVNFLIKNDMISALIVVMKIKNIFNI